MDNDSFVSHELCSQYKVLNRTHTGPPAGTVCSSILLVSSATLALILVTRLSIVSSSFVSSFSASLWSQGLRRKSSSSRRAARSAAISRISDQRSELGGRCKLLWLSISPLIGFCTPESVGRQLPTKAFSMDSNNEMSPSCQIVLSKVTPLSLNKLLIDSWET